MPRLCSKMLISQQQNRFSPTVCFVVWLRITLRVYVNSLSDWLFVTFNRMQIVCSKETPHMHHTCWYIGPRQYNMLNISDLRWALPWHPSKPTRSFLVHLTGQEYLLILSLDTSQQLGPLKFVMRKSGKKGKKWHIYLSVWTRHKPSTTFTKSCPNCAKECMWSAFLTEKVLNVHRDK